MVPRLLTPIFRLTSHVSLLYESSVAGETLLIVDDDSFMRDLLTESLSEAEYATEAAQDGKQALSLLSRSDFQVALVDLSLPDMGGMEVVDYLSNESPDTQIIIMTGYPSLQSAIDALRKGAQDYIVKPFKIPEVRAAVSRALKNQQLQAEVRSLRRRVHDLEGEARQLRAGSVSRQPSPSGRPAPRSLPGAYGTAATRRPPAESEGGENPDETG